MIGIFKIEEVSKFIDNYLGRLSETGYVSEGTSRKMLLYFFLLDFADTLFPFITEADYDKINKVLSCVFNGKNCLFPYPAIAPEYRTTVGLPVYMASVLLRATEINKDPRKTELDSLRTVI